jgi:hypothetical protein
MLRSVLVGRIYYVSNFNVHWTTAPSGGLLYALCVCRVYAVYVAKLGPREWEGHPEHRGGEERKSGGRKRDVG